MTMTIPNWLTGGMAAAFFIFAMVFPLPEGAASAHLTFALVVLLVGVFSYHKMNAGAGLMKFYAAAALWMGADVPFFALVLVSTSLASVYAFAQGQWRADRDITVAPFAYAAFLLCFPYTESWSALSVSHADRLAATLPPVMQPRAGHPLPSSIRLSK